MRVALLSLRAMRQVPWFGGIVDAEDALAGCFSGPVHHVEVAAPAFRAGPLASEHLRRAVTWTRVVRPYRIRHDPRYGDRPADVVVVLLNDLHDAALLLGLPGWQRLGEVVVMHCAEINDRELRLYPEVVRHLRRHVDHLFVSIASPGVDALYRGRSRSRRGDHRLRTTALVPPMLDVLAFPDRPRSADRAIDVLNIGRRSPAQHGLLQRWAQDSGGFYVFDTGYLAAVRSLADHRRLFTQFASRARVFVANPAAFDKGRRGFRTPQMGARYWEGMAAGCVLAGAAPTGSPLYPAIAPAQPVRMDLDAAELPGELLDVLADPAEQERRGRAGRALALRGADVAHRWREMAAYAGLPESAGVACRADRLRQAADAVSGPGRGPGRPAVAHPGPVDDGHARRDDPAADRRAAHQRSQGARSRDDCTRWT